MAMTRQPQKNDCIIGKTLEELVPRNHLVRKMEASMNFDFIEDEVEHLYSKTGRPSIPPKVLFKMLIINIVFGINSMRRTCEECKVNLAFLWFLGLSIEDEVPNYSTWSQNYRRRYKDSEIFETIFDRILSQADKYGYIDLETVYGDSTHQKASANKNKHRNVEVEIARKVYEEELLKEINEERKAQGKKEFESLIQKEVMFDEETGELIENTKTKHIKESKTDPESGCYHKGEKEKCFAYSHHAFCEKNGFVIAQKTVAGNIHDSVSFFDIYAILNEKYKEKIKNICLDAAYTTPAICREIILNEQIPLMPYTRPRTKKEFMKKHEYVYDEYYDCYICPNNEILRYTTTDRNGYRIYKSDNEKCKNCPLKDKCTKNKQNQKTITRHVWEKD